MLRVAVVLASTACLSLCATAQAEAAGPCDPAIPVTHDLAATTNVPGAVGLFFFLAQGAPVSYFECRGEDARHLGTVQTAGEVTVLKPAARWRCDRLERAFAAVARLPDGTWARGVTGVRTMSCAHRYRLTAPVRARRGQSAPVRVYDRWLQGGVRARLCVTPPHASASCRPVRLRRAVDSASRLVRLDRRGAWRVSLRAPHARLSQTIAVGVDPSAGARSRPSWPRGTRR